MKHGWTKQTLLAGLFLMGCESEEAPVSCAAFGDTAIPIHVPDQYAVRFCFTDENGDALTVRAKSSEPKTVHLWTRPVDSPSPEEAILEALAPGASTITITATDPGGLSATEMFRVIVPNRMPVLVKPLRQLDKKVGQKVRVDLPGHFTDPDLEVLTYEAWVTDASVAAVRRTGGTVIVEALAPGSTVLVARAADPAGLAAVDSADVSVVSATLKIGVLAGVPFPFRRLGVPFHAVEPFHGLEPYPAPDRHRPEQVARQRREVIGPLPGVFEHAGEHSVREQSHVLGEHAGPPSGRPPPEWVRRAVGTSRPALRDWIKQRDGA